ncbi:MAG: sigma-54 dependent transcriptional regulator [Verrucomicrobiales bacterium]|nr:sigma-54 dependent transcriptional regulator [Verrucomicrobiales bacterium]
MRLPPDWLEITIRSVKSILLVEDDADLRESLSDVLRRESFEVTVASDGKEGLSTFQNGDFHLALVDYRLPEIGGIDLLSAFRQKSDRMPVILMTAHGTTRLAIEATRKGAFDYLIKPFRSKDLIETVNRALQVYNTSGKNVKIKATDGEEETDLIVGTSRGMQEVYREIGKIADKSVTVLIQGETGTGKELVARAVHKYGNRHDGPFVAVNCSAIPENLLESELFGHEKGAFTGAVSQRIGRFEQADGGTLFLDEIGDMIPETQVKMLRVLQEKTIRRVGGDEEIPFDVRVIAATHQNLEDAVAQGHFRGDLYFRINTAIIDIPPLRERTGDISLLVQHFLSLYCKDFNVETLRFEKGVIEALENHSWPGNVRELENLVRKMIIKSNGYLLSLDDVEEVLKRSANVTKVDNVSSAELLRSQHVREVLLRARSGALQHPHAFLVEELESEMIVQALEICGHNQSSACRLLGVSRASFRDKMDKYGLLIKSED